MKYAVVSGERQEAQPGLSAECPSCARPMVAKCGEIKIWHWAHLGTRTCDPWWENETEWHRAWKGLFPVDWQEIVHRAESGEKHIADVKTDHGWVLEFQHSYLKPEERRARDSFYPKLVWVVDGTRRKRDQTQFFKAFKDGIPVGAHSFVRKIYSDECGLLREWAGCRASVFLDFGIESAVWWLFPTGTDGWVHAAQFSRPEFVGLHRSGTKEQIDEFAKFLQDIPALVAGYYSQLGAAQRLQNGRAPQPQGFQHYLARRARSRRRF